MGSIRHYTGYAKYERSCLICSASFKARWEVQNQPWCVLVWVWWMPLCTTDEAACAAEWIKLPEGNKWSFLRPQVYMKENKFTFQYNIIGPKENILGLVQIYLLIPGTEPAAQLRKIEVHRRYCISFWNLLLVRRMKLIQVSACVLSDHIDFCLIEQNGWERFGELSCNASSCTFHIVSKHSVYSEKLENTQLSY